MPSSNNHEYLQRRERECREAAERANDPAIRRTHLQFAQRYAEEAELAKPPLH